MVALVGLVLEHALAQVLELVPARAHAPELVQEHALTRELAHALAPVLELAVGARADASRKLKTKKNWRPNDRQFFCSRLFFEKIKWRAMIQLNQICPSLIHMQRRQ